MMSVADNNADNAGSEGRVLRPPVTPFFNDDDFPGNNFAQSAEDLARAALDHLGETEELRTSALAELKSWMRDQNDFLYNSDVQNDRILLGFLRACKFNMAKVKKKMCFYYNLPEHFPSWFPLAADPTDPEIIKYSKMCFPLPVRSASGCPVWLLRPGNFDVETDDSDRAMTCLYLLFDLALGLPESQIYGLELIVDHQGWTWRHYYAFGPSFTLRVAKVWLKGYAARMKGIHMLDEGRIVDLMFAACRPVLPEKILKRYFFHGSGEKARMSLMKHFGETLLPDEYGGEAGSIDKLKEMTFQALQRNRQFLLNRFSTLRET